MLLTLTTTHEPATDLGYLLYKHPDRVQTFELSAGRAHVFYPEATETRCTAALLLDLDPVGLVRRDGAPLAQYVNDRPYAATSFLSVAIGQVFGTALSGICRDRPELADTAIPLEATLPALPVRGDADLLRRLFEPLGYAVEAARQPLDPNFPAWGDSAYTYVTLRATVRLTDLLSHLYVLIPALDGDKHYWVGDDEVDKLLRHGEGWLAAHPERDFVTARYLARNRGLIHSALDRLREIDGELPEEDHPPRRSLNTQRHDAVLERLNATGARTVVDLGCGEGKLTKLLMEQPQYTRIVGVDVSHRALERAKRRLRLDTLPTAQRDRVELLHGSLFYRDTRIEQCDAVAVVEVIEHLDPDRVDAFAEVLFRVTRPAWVVLTTPNAEYNAVWATLPAGEFRHDDHRFEWTRADFAAWVAGVPAANGYVVHEVFGIGDPHDDFGAPTQGAVLRREDT